jgi:hypothetical protein
MWPHLLLDAAGRVVVLAAAVGLAAAARALASVLRTWIEQAARTHRLTKAIEGARPNQRPAIIQACSQLEGKPAGRPARDTLDGAFSPGGIDVRRR